jgi:hypothetical protein
VAADITAKLLMKSKNWDSKVSSHIAVHVLGRCNVSRNTSPTSIFHMLHDVDLDGLFFGTTTPEQMRTYVYRCMWRIFDALCSHEDHVPLSKWNSINNTRFPDGIFNIWMCSVHACN